MQTSTHMPRGALLSLKSRTHGGIGQPARANLTAVMVLCQTSMTSDPLTLVVQHRDIMIYGNRKAFRRRIVAKQMLLPTLITTSDNMSLHGLSDSNVLQSINNRFAFHLLRNHCPALTLLYSVQFHP